MVKIINSKFVFVGSSPTIVGSHTPIPMIRPPPPPIQWYRWFRGKKKKMSIMIIVSIIISVFIILATFFLNKNTPAYGDKLSQYECGFEPIEAVVDGGERYFIKFHIVAVIFLIFDLEAILLFPFISISTHANAIPVFFLFMSFLILGLLLEFHKAVF